MSSISNFLFSLPTSLLPSSSQNPEDAVAADENTADTHDSSSPSMDESHLPITGICLVTKPGNVPTGYQCIRKTYDERNKDADLMPDSFLERKDRFVCITHAYPLAGDRTYVIEDIRLINEREAPPPSYTALTHTVDTSEKATVKRTICVKLVDRQAGMNCVCDIVFLYRAKRPPQLYTMIGDINGLQMCIKEGTVPPLRAPQSSSHIYPTANGNHAQYGTQQSYTGADHSNTHTLTKKSDEKEMLDGIPFEINPKYLRRFQQNGRSRDELDSCQALSSYEIEQLFDYDFQVERAWL